MNCWVVGLRPSSRTLRWNSGMSGTGFRIRSLLSMAVFLTFQRANSLWLQTHTHTHHMVNNAGFNSGHKKQNIFCSCTRGISTKTHFPAPPAFPSSPTRCQVWESKCVVGGNFVRWDAEVSQIFGGDFCKQTESARQILSNVTRRSTAVGAGKHLTPHRRRLWELNPRLLQLQSVYWPTSKKKKTFTQLERLWQPDSSAAGKEKMRSDDKNLHYLVSSWDSIRLCMCECVRRKAWCAHTSASEVRECSLPTGYVKMSHPLCPARWVECRATKVNDNTEKWTTLLLLLLLSIFGPKMFPDYWLIVLKAFPLSGPAPRLSLDVFNGSKIQTPTAASVCGSIKSATRQKNKKTKKYLCRPFSDNSESPL